MMKSIITALLLSLALSGCGTLVSDPGADRSAFPTEGVDQRNLGVEPRRSPVAAGDAVPSIYLNDQKGWEVSTLELMATGDALLIFHPGDATPESRAVYPWIQSNKGMITQRGAEILIISPDSVEINDAVATREELRVGILSDPSAWGARTFGLMRTSGGVRVGTVWSVLIGKEGRVLAAQPGLMSVSEVITALTVRPTGDSYRVLDMIN